MNPTLDPHVLRKQLSQLLEHLKRSGIASVPALSAEDLSPATIEAVQRALAEGSHPQAGSSVSAPTPTVTPSVDPTVAQSAPPAVPQPAAPAAPVQPGEWQLPVVALADREAAIAPIDAEVKDCKHCTEIVGFRQQTVFGEGRLDAKICFIGEAPGADEDRTGRPFVGKAGQLLTKIIQAMKLSREDIYIMNALKCRPPQNRTPIATEIESCRGFAQRQLELIQPQYIVCLGAVAVRSLLGAEQSIGRLRGRFHTYRGAKVIVTYHPSYLLRNESAKRLVWDDMKMLMAEMEADGTAS